jgi:hypothetical protein
MLDLSAAFNTLDHEILLNRLRSTFGITGTALTWFKSYVTGRSQAVTIDGEVAEPAGLQFGVPQGSVLGPKLYSMYTQPLTDVIQQHDVNDHYYADDTQLYHMFTPRVSNSLAETVCALENTAKTVKDWMVKNKLKLNDDKTEVLTISSKHQAPTDPVTLQIGNTPVTSKPVVHDLGVLLDCHMSMEKHVNSVCRSARFQLRNISHIRRYLTMDATKSLVHAMVTPRIDYCNALLYGLPCTPLKELQLVQNISARIMTKTLRCQPITPVLKELHWLPIKSRISYKVLVHFFKALQDEAPVYI